VAIDWWLLIPLGAGIVTAIVSLAGIVLEVLGARPVEASAAFLGMVAASVSIPWMRIRTHDRSTYAIAAVAAVLAFMFSGLPLGEAGDPSTLRIFASAMVAICAMILPGVSGAFLLLVLGMYQPTLDAVDSRDFGYVLTFVAGAALGIGLFSLALGAALRSHHDRTMAALVGLMIGSLRALWPWQTDDRVMLAPTSTGSAATALGIALVGFAIVTAIERLARERTTDALQPGA
jgi:putative membrane protein